MWIILNFFVFFKVLILLSMYPTCIEECHLIFRYCIQHLLAAAESIEWRIPAFLFRLSLIQGPRIVPIVVLYCFFLIFWFPFSLSLSLLVFFSYLYVSFFCSEIESGENRFSPCQYWNRKKDWKFDLQKNIGNMGCSFLLHPVLENEIC